MIELYAEIWGKVDIAQFRAIYLRDYILNLFRKKFHFWE